MQPNYEDPDPELDRRLMDQRSTAKHGTIVIALTLVVIGLCVVIGLVYG